jgi:hypothetical protein
MANGNPNGRNQGNKTRPIGIQTIFRSPTEGHDAYGRDSHVVKDEFPTRIDEVSKTLFYLGWAILNEGEDEPCWKIRRIQQMGDVWYQEYAYANQFYRYKWTERSFLPYA